MLSEEFWGFMRIYEELWGFMKIYEDFWWFLRISEDSEDFWGFPRISEDFWGYLKISDNFWWFLRISGDFGGFPRWFLRFSEDFWGFLRISEDFLDFWGWREALCEVSSCAERFVLVLAALRPPRGRCRREIVAGSSRDSTIGGFFFVLLALRFPLFSRSQGGQDGFEV